MFTMSPTGSPPSLVPRPLHRSLTILLRRISRPSSLLPSNELGCVVPNCRYTMGPSLCVRISLCVNREGVCLLVSVSMCNCACVCVWESLLTLMCVSVSMCNVQLCVCVSQRVCIVCIAHTDVCICECVQCASVCVICLLTQRVCARGLQVETLGPHVLTWASTANRHVPSHSWNTQTRKCTLSKLSSKARYGPNSWVFILLDIMLQSLKWYHPHFLVVDPVLQLPMSLLKLSKVGNELQHESEPCTILCQFFLLWWKCARRDQDVLCHITAGRHRRPSWYYNIWFRLPKCPSPHHTFLPICSSCLHNIF